MVCSPSVIKFGLVLSPPQSGRGILRNYNKASKRYCFAAHSRVVFLPWNPVRDQKGWYSHYVRRNNMLIYALNLKGTNRSVTCPPKVDRIGRNNWVGSLDRNMLGASYLPANLPAEASAQAGASSTIVDISRQMKFTYHIIIPTCSAFRRWQAGL